MPTRASKFAWQQICRTATAILLTVSFQGLLIAVTAFGIFTNNRELLEGVLKIVTYGVMFSCVCAGGTSWLCRQRKKSRILNEDVKDSGSEPVPANVESHKEG
jgi:hypothetical protein